MYEDLHKRAWGCERVRNHIFSSESCEALEGDTDETGMKRILDINFFLLHCEVHRPH